MNDVWALNLDTLRWELMSPNIFAKRRCDRIFGGGDGDRRGILSRMYLFHTSFSLHERNSRSHL